MQVEGHIADLYWRYLQKALPKKFGFTYRMHESHQMNASDPVNVLLNYGYAILESQCRKALNSVGLEPTVGFLHETRQTRYPLVYDLQEPFRWLIDTTVIECLEYDRFNRKDFYRVDNYVLRLRPEAVKRLLSALRIRFNSPVKYESRLYSWDTIIRSEVQDLARYILHKRSKLDFTTPSTTLGRDDSKALRDRTLSISMAEARQLGIRKSTLWYLQHRAQGRRPFETYRPVKNKLRSLL